MKKLVASLALAAIALLPAQAASADTLDLTAGVFPYDQLAAQSSTGHQFGVGGGTTATGTHFAFSAHCKPAAELEDCPADSGTASGYAVVSDPVLGKAQGHVCFMQVLPPADAIFSIVVEKGSGILGSFPNLSLVGVDNGNPSAAVPDLFGFDPRSACGSFAGGFDAVPVVQGNIVVKN